VRGFKSVLFVAVGREGEQSVLARAAERAGVPGLLIGNTAESVLNAVDCSVLTLKPDGFETPIQV
jgi:universal stress protein E